MRDPRALYPSPAVALAARRHQVIDRLIYQYMDDHRIPGMVLAVARAPFPPRSVGYGVSDLDRDELVSAQTVWALGPMSQGFCTVAVLQLAERGRADLHAAIGDLLDEIPQAWSTIPVLRLLQHTSGIPDYRNHSAYAPNLNYTARELIDLAAAQPPTFEPGTQAAVSATDSLLLALLVERISGQPYHLFIRENQALPLGLQHIYFTGEQPYYGKENDMTDTGLTLGGTKEIPSPEANTPLGTFSNRWGGTAGDLQGNIQSDMSGSVSDDTPADEQGSEQGEAAKQKGMGADQGLHSGKEQFAVGYYDDGEGFTPVRAGGGDNLKGFGDVWGSGSDAAYWAMALTGKGLLARDEYRDLLLRPAQLASGTEARWMAGWNFDRRGALVGLHGSIPGFSVSLYRFNADGETVHLFLAANREGTDLSIPGRRVAAAFDASLGPGINEEEYTARESMFPVPETVARIERVLAEKCIPIFAVFDHGQHAAESGLTLLPTQVVVFGSARSGTPLMQRSRSMALELPLRLAVWEDERERVWIVHERMHRIAARNGIVDDAAIRKLETTLEDIALRAASL